LTNRLRSYNAPQAAAILQSATISEQHMNKLSAEGWKLVDTRDVPFQQGGATLCRPF
jgi:hypothetical protein